ncbi:hypothetical protein KTT_04990 [Tengunoibacter tsumagoiensis]|uniref:Beta-lactamase class A catalytic domain-containing protein n=2 Tax=Tengunoibacter tsumagoiensis TaxID=2014871 RepID=A0A401ZV76_9CHLR|nr:hypothetical protein KTT_04990 [Tengunoibacter tsumagoiensis]
MLLAFVVIMTGTIVIYIRFPLNDSLYRLSNTSAAGKTIVSQNADLWSNDVQVTAPTMAFSLQNTQNLTISPLFSQYYQNYGAASGLGSPITVAFPVANGWVQFFTSDALFLPAATQNRASTSNTMLTELIENGTKTAHSNVIRLPLLQALLTVGSQAHIAGDNSTFSYVDLRKAVSANLLQQPKKTTTNKEEQFIKTGTSAGNDVGHFISASLWSYLNRPEVAPDGWQTDFGLPLTEALPLTVVQDGAVHHLEIQAFTRNAFLLDKDVSGPDGQPAIQPLNTGIDYLRTLGMPTVKVSSGQLIWSQNDTAIYSEASPDHALAHIAKNFQFTLLGDTKWNTGVLWYHVQWSTPKKASNQGWVSAADMTLSAPGKGPEWASIDLLSNDLASYLSGIGPRAGVVIYDEAHQRYYTYNNTNQFITASSVKVPIMLTFFDMIEQQGRDPDDNEMNLLTTMIENSNNDSTSELYYNHIGGAAGMAAYFQKIGVAGLNPSADAWGYSQISPQAMVDLLTLLHDGKILTASHRATAINLMENVESDQQVGVGDTAPGGATVAMKDGWVTGDDDLWAMNSSGIVTTGKTTYIISVYTQENQSLDDGQAIVRKVCSTVASLLS